MHYIPRRRAVALPSMYATSSGSSGTVLQPSDFTYLGQVRVPDDDTPNGIRFAFSQGAMSGRVVGSDIHLFLTGATADTGWPDPVYEIKYNGIGSQCTMVTNWWDVTAGQCVGGVNTKPLYGLLWDETSASCSGRIRTRTREFRLESEYRLIHTDDAWRSADRDGVWSLADNGIFRIHGRVSPLRAAGIPVWYEWNRMLCGSSIASGNAASPWGVYASSFTIPSNSSHSRCLCAWFLDAEELRDFHPQRYLFQHRPQAAAGKRH